jgi:hypothetical protein
VSGAGWPGQAKGEYTLSLKYEAWGLHGMFRFCAACFGLAWFYTGVVLGMIKAIPHEPPNPLQNPTKQKQATQDHNFASKPLTPHFKTNVYLP